MKKFILIFLLYLPFTSFSQTWIDDSNFEDSLTAKHAFDDDESGDVVVIEFWAKFNEANAFADWSKVDIPYVRVDIGKAPEAKKKYKVRMAPTIILFKEGFKEEVWKAGLDLECPVTLQEIEEAIEQANQASQF